MQHYQNSLLEYINGIQIIISTNKAFIKRSVQFEEEPLATIEVGESSSSPQPLIVNEETNEFENYDMSDNDDLISYPNSPTRSKLEARIIHATRELARNPSDNTRTRSQFESDLCVKDPLFAEKCYLMVEYDPQTYEYGNHCMG